MTRIGEAFVALGLLFIMFSYSTPWTWQTDVAVIILFFGIATALNDVERRRR